jgi:ABC-2 type transport system permease protein
VEFATVLRAKNIAAAFFVLLEVTLIQVVCMAVGLRVTARQAAESYAVALVLAILALALGNLASVYNPKAVDPAQSWRNSPAGKTQILLLLVLPLVIAPVALAFLARWALDSELAFFAVLAVMGALAAVVYWVAMESAVAAASDRRERFIEALSSGSGPISAG